jgi:hypothetical protein
MAIAVNATKEALADAYIALGAYVSLHTSSPGSTGANEATGGSPAYARQQTTWGADSTDDGVRAGSEVTIDAAAGTYTHMGLWTAASGGTFIDGAALSSSVTLGAQGQVKVTPTYTQS